MEFRRVLFRSDSLYYVTDAVMDGNNKPVYLRLREIISASILEGEYRDGDMLPSVRAFAAQQGANPLTVAKAYQSFQDDGLVIVKRGVGMLVAEGDRKSTRLNSSHSCAPRMPSSA